MKVMNTVDYLNATEKKAPATSNDMFALLMQMASISPRPIAKCDSGILCASLREGRKWHLQVCRTRLSFFSGRKPL